MENDISVSASWDMVEKYHYPKYICPTCKTETQHEYITVSIKDFSLNGKYCMTCYATWLSQNVPKLVEII